MWSGKRKGSNLCLALSSINYSNLVDVIFSQIRGILFRRGLSFSEVITNKGSDLGDVWAM